MCSMALPAIAGVYLVFTVDSAWQDARGHNGLWKGRVYPDRGRSVRAFDLLMAKAYAGILGRLLARNFMPPRRPVRTGRAALVWSVLRYGLV